MLQKGSVANTLIASGSTQIDKKISLSFGTSGNLSEILVEEGDNVTEGQLLAELDSKDLQNALERQQLQLNKLLDYPSEEDLKNALYLVNQAQKALNDLLEYPSIEQLRTAEELVSQAEANFITAQENYDELMVPTDVQFDSVTKLIEQAEQAVSNSNLLLENARRNVDASMITLTESVNNYCDVDSLPKRENVCVSISSYPVDKSVTDAILDEIFKCCDANTTEMNLSKALINSSIICPVNAFSLSGRFKVKIKIPLSTSYFIVSYFIKIFLFYQVINIICWNATDILFYFLSWNSSNRCTFSNIV